MDFKSKRPKADSRAILVLTFIAAFFLIGFSFVFNDGKYFKVLAPAIVILAIYIQFAFVKGIEIDLENKKYKSYSRFFL